ncbi:MAG TPA: hypothetical protein PLX69_16675 [Leptospiraceae bacterium]|nr:hypothetical protein [Leptospiraceae bacterium]HRG76197.1 hypothetical protein [Leptospiraceae bacterium]
MKTFETLMDVTDSGDLFFHIPKELKPGRYKVVLVVDEETIEESFSFTNEQKIELEKRLKRIKENPHSGFTKEEVIQRLEARIGRKLQV